VHISTTELKREGMIWKEMKSVVDSNMIFQKNNLLKLKKMNFLKRCYLPNSNCNPPPQNKEPSFHEQAALLYQPISRDILGSCQ